MHTPAGTPSRGETRLAGGVVAAAVVGLVAFPPPDPLSQGSPLTELFVAWHLAVGIGAGLLTVGVAIRAASAGLEVATRGRHAAADLRLLALESLLTVVYFVVGWYVFAVLAGRRPGPELPGLWNVYLVVGTGGLLAAAVFGHGYTNRDAD